MRLVCIGDCGIDAYHAADGDVRELCGGVTFNFAIHARDLFGPEWQIQVITAVGHDGAGERIRRIMQDNGLELCLSRCPGNTPVQKIEVQADGDRRFTGYEAGVLSTFRMGRPETEWIRESDLLMTVHFREITDLFLSVLDCPGKGLKAVDFADFSDDPSLSFVEECIPRLDIAFFGLQVEQHDLISGLQQLACRYDKLFIVTLAEAGSLTFTRDATCKAAAVPVSRVVDTTGAGDSFAAAFLSNWIRTRDIPAALHHGAARAAATISCQGATRVATDL